ncbi:MAG: hypothetical protein AAGC73_04085 [Verrucomicrobiota bacterium]
MSRKRTVSILAAIACAAINSLSANELYSLKLGSWGKFIQPPVEIFVSGKPEKEMSDLIDLQEQSIKNVLNASLSLSEIQEYHLLVDKIQALKAAVDKERVPDNYIPYNATLYEKYQSRMTARFQILDKLKEQCSQTLSSSFTSTVGNINPENFESRIESVQQFSNLWSERTSKISDNGPDGRRKKANERFLGIVDIYISELRKLATDLTVARAVHSHYQEARQTHLLAWQEFVNKDLPVIQAYFEEIEERILPNSEGNYLITKQQMKSRLYASTQIGTYQVYFYLNKFRNKEHPLNLEPLN